MSSDEYYEESAVDNYSDYPDTGTDWTDIGTMGKPGMGDDTGKVLIYMSDSQSLPMLRKLVKDEWHVSPRYRQEVLYVIGVYLSPDMSRMYIPKFNRYAQLDPLKVIQNRILLEVRCTRIWATKDDRRHVNCRTFENKLYMAICAYLSRSQGVGAERGIATQVQSKSISEHTQYNPGAYGQGPQRKRSFIDVLTGGK